MQKISHYFDKFKKYFLPNLSLTEVLFCFAIFINSLVALIECIFVWIKERDDINLAIVTILDVFFNSVLVITSGIITAIFRTLNHIIINCIVNVTLVLYIYYFIYNNAKIPGSEAFIYLHTILLLLIVLIVIIWLRRERKRLFVIIEQNKIIVPEIQRTYRWYYLQQTLSHAQIIVAMFLQNNYLNAIVKNGYFVGPIDLVKYIPWPNILLCFIAIIMIKGVRKESKYIMIVFYLASLILCGYHLYIIIETLRELTSQQNYLTEYILEKKIEIGLDIISLFITIITMINSKICYDNFGKGLKNYLLKDELQHFKELIYYDDDIDECYDN